MQTKFRRHQIVKTLRDASPEYVEYNDEFDVKHIKITKGMRGRINLILPNGKYHVEILDESGGVIAYAPFEEDDLEESE